MEQKVSTLELFEQLDYWTDYRPENASSSIYRVGMINKIKADIRDILTTWESIEPINELASIAKNMEILTIEQKLKQYS